MIGYARIGLTGGDGKSLNEGGVVVPRTVLGVACGGWSAWLRWFAFGLGLDGVYGFFGWHGGGGKGYE